MSHRERILLAGLAAASLVLRALAFFRYRFDSDEPQHLHVAWGWTAGMVQYRDFFDNHSPLFHLLSAPLLALLGERANILLWMRAPMLLLFALVLGCTYVMARRRYDERVALWSVVVLSLFPPFFLKSLEYRNDNLWTALCVLALLLIPSRRSLLVGFILGCALAVSLKTIPLIIAFLIADLRNAKRIAAGAIIVPAALALYFASVGAWPRLVYCLFNFNEAGSRPYAWIARFAWPLLVAAIIVIARKQRASLEAVVVIVYIVTLLCIGVPISPRDFLAIMPLVAIFAASRFDARALAAACAIFIASLVYYADKFENRTDEHITAMNQVLRLTRPGEPLLDVKGETIYRPRPTYPMYENITRAQIAHGLIPDTVPEDVVRARCYVAQADGPMWPPRARAFLSENFMDMGRIRAAGQWIADDGTFTIAIPGPYAVVNENGIVQNARVFAAGAHRFERTKDERVAVLWAPAFARGFSPFHLQDRDF